VDEKGEEHVIEFAVDDWWASDLHSFLTGEPATFNIDALEDSRLLLLDRDSRESLLKAVPKMERFFRLLQEAHYVATHRRISETLSKTADERYLSFLNMHADLARRIPQKHIASYLGITPQSLSRVRKEFACSR
jgi:CRP-like cAMP-binding protein